jgi:cytochrome P450
VLSRYADADAAFREPLLSAGERGAWHEQYRRAASTAFSGPRLAEWRSSIEQEAKNICGRLQSGATLDLIHDFARPFSAATSDIVTGQSREEARQCARAIFLAAAEPFDAWLQEHGSEATRRLAEMFHGDFAPLFIQAFVALTESLPAFLANSCYAMLHHNARAATSTAIEELLRFAGPSKAQLRRAVQAVRIGGATIAPYDRVVLMLASANRDPDVFSRPLQLNLTRSPNQHLAFGVGEHSCLGAALVRMASGIAFQALLEAFPTMTLTHVSARQKYALRVIESLQALPSTILHPAQR